MSSSRCFPILFLLLAKLSTVAAVAAAPPKLVLQITIDQLRGDLPTRFLDRMGEDGFRYFYENGLIYTNAHHAHANTETIVGHATLATGAHPSTHGMIGNIWFDRGTKNLTYNIEDARYQLLSEGSDVNDETEIDPTQRAARSEGRSPSAILCSTFSDELALHTAGQAKIFGVSVKDRGAVSMAGHSGKAFWFSKAAGEWVTSNYYYSAYPDWVTAWNAQKTPQRYAGQYWRLLHDQSTYLYGDRDDQEWETSLPPFGRTFPHRYGPADSGLFTTLLTLSPAGDELTLDFAAQLIEHEAIGQDAVPDFLSVSFSSTDYVGHILGPSSLEAEDNLLRLDRTLARLIELIETKVGLANTLIVLSADHGGPEAPGALQEYGFEVDYVNPNKWETEASFAKLKERFGIGKKLIREYAHPYIYLDREVIEAQNLDMAEVERAVAEEIETYKGVALAVSSTALSRGQVPDTPLIRSVLHNYHRQRSGDVYVVFQPHWFINDFDGLSVAATHGSPWSYDQYVPMIFAGAGITAGKVHRRVHTVDVASTLAAFTGAKPPSGAAGDVLPEVVEGR